MTDYADVRIDCSPCNEDITSLIADSLAPLGYDSFVADETGLNAYIKADEYDSESLRAELREIPIPVQTHISVEIVKGKDWNEEWEKNYFKPIRIGNRCLVRSSFHPSEEAEYEIVIDPKMAFGTGHHSTTSQMIGLLLDTPLQGKRIIDMGTGTGILSILAGMAGASDVTGIEIDPDAAENARANCALNHIPANIITGDASTLEQLQSADIFLANINRNIILADLDSYLSRLRTGGQLFLSGFYANDIPMIETACQSRGLRLKEQRIDNEWAALRFEKEK